jgi:hypothetical protein
MSASHYLSVIEFGSLEEVGSGITHAGIPMNHGRRLMDLGLVYSLLGNLRITTAGKTRIARGS